jgi:uncharacterized membrane protein YbhN (UPF0104 family)
MIVLGSLMSIVGIIFIRSTRTMYLALSAFGIAGLLIGALVVFYLLSDRIDEFGGSKVENIFYSLRKVRRSLAHVSSNPFALALSLLLSVPLWITEVATVFFAARAVGVQLPVVPAVAAGVSAFLSQTIPLTPGGIGTYEAAITSVLTLFEINTATGTTIGLVDHISRLGIIYLLGAISTVHLVFASRPYFSGKKRGKE